MPCLQIGDATVCYEPQVEVRREPYGKPRWCFRERKRTQHELVVTTSAGPSYYDPNPSIRCSSCHANDADLFPGYAREWEG